MYARIQTNGKGPQRATPTSDPGPRNHCARVATIEQNGQEFLVTLPEGTVFVALTLPEAEAIVKQKSR